MLQTLAVIGVIVVLLGLPVLVLLRSRGGMGRLPSEIGHAYLQPYAEITGLADYQSDRSRLHEDRS